MRRRAGVGLERDSVRYVNDRDVGENVAEMANVEVGHRDDGGRALHAAGQVGCVLGVEDVLGMRSHREGASREQGSVAGHLGGRCGEVRMKVREALAADAVGHQAGLHESAPIATSRCSRGAQPHDRPAGSDA